MCTRASLLLVRTLWCVKLVPGIIYIWYDADDADRRVTRDA